MRDEEKVGADEDWEGFEAVVCLRCVAEMAGERGRVSRETLAERERGRTPRLVGEEVTVVALTGPELDSSEDS